VSLTPGTLLGAYEVGVQIGAGGMGEVYRARDTRLHRDVALKVLPQAFAADPERLARFKREAQLLASLSHPNIGAIYGLEELASSSALVLELVEGPTLADHIASGPLPLDEAFSIATQVADALEAAHELGIVHRDLKPANIKLRPDGTVKVLDFGLAKALETAPSSTTVDNSPTITSPAMTQAGIILGTAAYMSPEQAKGLAADRRSDIWAFGVVVFEMLTARRAFGGEDVHDILAAVLRAEPEWSALPSNTPRSIRRLMRRCLQKDRRRRLQHIGDARLELADGDDSESPAPVVSVAARRQLWPIVVAAVSVAAVVAFAAWMMKPAPLERPVTRFTIQVPELMARVSGTGASVAISPDGRTLVYVVGGTRPGLERRQLHDVSAERVRGADGGSRPFFSPDGQWLGFFADNKLKKVPVAGGVAVTLADASRNARGAWGDDGSIVIARPDLRRVASTGGVPDVILESRDSQIFEAEFLPGSKSVLIAAGSPPNPGFIEIVDLETRTRRRLLDGGSPRLAATGDLLFMRQGRLWGATFDASRGEIVGTPVQLGGSVNAVEQSAEGPTYATARDGTFVFMAGETATSVVWLTRSGASTTALTSEFNLRNPRLSPDGGRVLVNGTSAADLWVFDFARGSRWRLTTAGFNRGGAWSPDGRQIAFFSLLQQLQPGLNDQDIFVIPSSGGSPTRVLERPGPQWVDSWSPDGRYLMLDDGPGFSRDLVVLPLGGEPRPFVSTRFNERSGVFSPDGGSVAFVSDESGRDDVYVLPFSGSGQKVPISVKGGRQPVWSRDGRELFYREDDAMMVVAVKHSPFQASAPRKLFDMPAARYGLDPYSADYDVAPDGRFISVRRDESPDIQVILNWTEELRRALGK
jgi:eukaryotic-like serine/threonine-protein kinase